MSNNVRLHRIDIIRGVAVILMVFYHLLFDLHHFFQKSIQHSELIFKFGPEIIGGLFLITSGLAHSMHFRTGRLKQKIRRSFFLLAIALFLSVLTYILFKNQLIIFGILHCISISTLLGICLNKTSNSFILLCSLFLISIGFFWLNSIPHPSIFFIPLGGNLDNRDYIMLDYFPLIPYFGEYLLGLWLGLVFIKNKISKNTETPKNYFYNFILLLGKNSLTIYLIHQPIILGFLYLLNYSFS